MAFYQKLRKTILSVNTIDKMYDSLKKKIEEDEYLSD